MFYPQTYVFKCKIITPELLNIRKVTITNAQQLGWTVLALSEYISYEQTHILPHCEIMTYLGVIRESM